VKAATRLAVLLLAVAATGSAMSARGETVEVDCFLEPRRMAVVSAPVIGVVEKIEVEPGDQVVEGQVLARLESSVDGTTVDLARARATSEASLRRAKVRDEFEERRLARGRELHARGALSDHELDELESARIVAKNELEAAIDVKTVSDLELARAEAILAQRTVRSPFSGVVHRQLLSEGEYADPPRILEIAQVDPLRVEVFAPVAMFGQVVPGMAAWIVPEAPIGGRHEARVVQVDSLVEAKSATFRIKLELPNPGNRIAPGLRCKAEIDLSQPGNAEAGDRRP
jgi:RND family efflux transporter MFP subunit